MESGVIGAALDTRIARIMLFFLLVWLAVAVGIVLAGLLPQLPDGLRALMAPTLADKPGSEPDVHLG